MKEELKLSVSPSEILNYDNGAVIITHEGELVHIDSSTLDISQKPVKPFPGTIERSVLCNGEVVGF